MSNLNQVFMGGFIHVVDQLEVQLVFDRLGLLEISEVYKIFWHVMLQSYTVLLLYGLVKNVCNKCKEIEISTEFCV